MTLLIETEMEGFPDSSRTCRECGKEIPPNRNRLKRGRARYFCCDECRQKYWNEHRDKDRWACFQKQVCPYCGKEFYAEHETKRSRTYCSRACANRGRALEKRKS